MLTKLPTATLAALPKIEGAYLVPTLGPDVGAYMEWGDEQGCDLYILFEPGVRYHYFVECLDGTYRTATDDEVNQYLAHAVCEEISVKPDELRLERNSNYPEGDIRANYFLMYGNKCIGGIDTHSGVGLLADVHVPHCYGDDPDDEDSWGDTTVVWQGQYQDETDFEACKDALMKYARIAIASNWIPELRTSYV